jgi:hypothetical protein
MQYLDFVGACGRDGPKAWAIAQQWNANLLNW